jgi:hypothetical protein
VDDSETVWVEREYVGRGFRSYIRDPDCHLIEVGQSRTAEPCAVQASDT